MDWQNRLNFFFDHFEHKANVQGILVCGSYITGGANIHSDLDVHFVFDDGVDFRQRGNRYVDGLLIEYLANPPRQIRRYFEEDLADFTLNSIVQFATGEIIMDRAGVAATLKSDAIELHKKHYEASPAKIMLSINKYSIWDMKDDLAAARSTGRIDFDFLHHVFLDRLIALYMRHIGRPYSPKIILGNVDDDKIRKKYMLSRLPDPSIAELIAASITTSNPDRKYSLFVELADKVLEKFGGFEIDGFRFKSALSDNL